MGPLRKQEGAAVVITLQQIDTFADLIEMVGDWVAANWVRSQAQELQVEINRRLA